ncbi:MAG: DUF4136 domain-containing protein [Bacteroidales bacterium]|nr:DUF4136 domain-containing protein [Bacteroidales bacterium]
MSSLKNVRRYFIYLFFVPIPLLFFSCYPGGIEYYSETDIVATQYDKIFDFASNQDYFMPDTIHHVVEEGKEDDVDRSYDDEILAKIATHMAAAGYTRFESDVIADSILVDSANVVLTVVITSTEYSGIGYMPGGGGYWGWYPGWGWGGGYYPGYPWYPEYGWGYPYTYSFSTGSMFIEMIDEDGIDHTTGELPIPWQATINGLLSGDADNMQWRVDKAIDQCFDQSQYLFN